MGSTHCLRSSGWHSLMSLVFISCRVLYVFLTCLRVIFVFKVTGCTFHMLLSQLTCRFQSSLSLQLETPVAVCHAATEAGLPSSFSLAAFYFYAYTSLLLFFSAFSSLWDSTLDSGGTPVPLHRCTEQLGLWHLPGSGFTLLWWSRASHPGYHLQ